MVCPSYRELNAKLDSNNQFRKASLAFTQPASASPNAANGVHFTGGLVTK